MVSWYTFLKVLGLVDLGCLRHLCFLLQDTVILIQASKIALQKLIEDSASSSTSLRFLGFLGFLYVNSRVEATTLLRMVPHQGKKRARD